MADAKKIKERLYKIGKERNEIDEIKKQLDEEEIDLQNRLKVLSEKW